MRLPMGLVAGLMAAGLAGCSTAPGGPAASPLRTTHAATPTPAVPAGPREPRTRSGARAAAMYFYGLYQANQFAAAWSLLDPSAQRRVPQKLWVQVHAACEGTGARAIRAVTIFGDAAIITQSPAGAHSRRRTGRDIFDYAAGRWAYSPSDLSIYEHGSAAADIAAAKEAGLCRPASKTTL
jgi:hypothetical protein